MITDPGQRFVAVQQFGGSRILATVQTLDEPRTALAAVDMIVARDWKSGALLLGR